VKGHVDGETMAAFREDLLPARKAARIAAHLSSCPRCAEVDAQLADVTAILARTPAPPMPASLVARLDAALAAEVASAGSPAHADSTTHADSTAHADNAVAADSRTPADGTSPGQTAPGRPALGHTGPGRTGPGRTAPPGDTERRGAGTGPGHTGPGRRAGRPRATSRLSLRLAAVTAAVVLLAGGGYAVARLVSAGSTGVSSSGAAAPHNGTSGQPASALGPEAAPRAAAGAGLPVITSGTIYRAGQLPAQVSAVLKRHPVPGQTHAPNPVTSPQGPLAAFPHLRACVSQLAGGRQPRLVDIAKYGNRPAAVIVVPVAGTARVRVWVVGPGCSGRGGDVIAQVSMPAPG
jgi:hypothetical protein